MQLFDERPLVGRTNELAAIAEILDRTVEGLGTLTGLVGDPGVGKTRLADQMVSMAQARGFVVHTGRAKDYEVRRVFGPVLDAFDLRLDQLVGHQEATRTVMEADAPGAMRFLVADRLFEEMENRSAAGPLLMIIEDVHWADTASLNWLRALADRVLSLPVAVLVTMRPTVPGTYSGRSLHPLESLIAKRRIMLGPLPQSDASTLATAVLGHQPESDLVEAIATAGGNPLIIIAVIEAQSVGGASGSQALSARLAELDDPALTALQVAAILGERISVPDLALLVDDPLSTLVRSVEAAVHAGFLVQDDEHLVFRHELYRRAVLHTVPASTQCILHVRAAQALSRAGAPPLQIAEHYVHGARSGDTEAVEWIAAAATQIVAASPGDALRLVDIALQLCGANPPIDLMVMQVRALAGVGRVKEAETLGRSLLHEELEPTEEARLRRELAFTALMQGHRPDCVREIERCAELTSEPSARARVLGEVAVARILAVDHAGADAAAVEAIREGTRHRDPIAKVVGESVLCLLDIYGNRMGKAIDRAESIVLLADNPAFAEAHFVQPWFVASLTWLETDQLDRLAVTARRGRVIAVQRGSGWAIPAYDAVTAFGALRAGCFDDAAATAQATLGYHKGVDGLGVTVWCHAFLAQMDIHRGELTSAAGHLGDAWGQLARDRAQLGYELVQVAQSTLLERQGDQANAVAGLAQAWDYLLMVAVHPPLVTIGGPLTRMACVAGDVGRVRSTVDTLAAAASTSGTVSTRVVAELAAAWRDADPDRALAAAKLAGTTPRLPLVAQTLSEAAALLRDQRRRAEANSVAQAASRRWSALGADGDAALCLQASNGNRRMKSRPRYGVEALTATEREVVARLAEGMPNSAIAVQLGISRRTVETHMSSIYRKLEVDSRVAVANIASRHAIRIGRSTG